MDIDDIGFIEQAKNTQLFYQFILDFIEMNEMSIAQTIGVLELAKMSLIEGTTDSEDE